MKKLKKELRGDLLPGEEVDEEDPEDLDPLLAGIMFDERGTIQGEQLNMTVLLEPCWKCLVDKSLFTRYQKNTATGHPVSINTPARVRGVIYY